MVEDLEQRVSGAYLPRIKEFAINKYRNFSWKGYLVDALAGQTFFQPIMVFNEMVLAGMSGKECLNSRILGFCIGSMISRPFGKFREYWARLLNTGPESSSLKKLLVDATGFLIPFVPIYSAVLYKAGASLDEMMIAVPAGFVIGRTYGKYLDLVRKRCRTEPTLDKEYCA